MEDLNVSIAARDGTALAVTGVRCPGEGPVLLVLHGIMSHSGWYRWIAEELAVHGISTYLADRRGVGASEGIRGHVTSWRVLADDVLSLVESVSSRHGGCGVHILGVSLGATVAMVSNAVHGDFFDSLVAFSPGLGTSIRVPLARRLRVLMHAFVQPHVLHELPFGVNELTDNEHLRRLFGEDPQRMTHVTARFLLETLKMQRSAIRHAPHLSVPVYALLAGEDGVVDNALTIRALSRHRACPVRIEVFDSATHCLPGVLPACEVTSRLSRWLLSYPRLGSPGVEVVHTSVPSSWRSQTRYSQAAS